MSVKYMVSKCSNENDTSKGLIYNNLNDAIEMKCVFECDSKDEFFIVELSDSDSTNEFGYDPPQ